MTPQINDVYPLGDVIQAFIFTSLIPKLFQGGIILIIGFILIHMLNQAVSTLFNKKRTPVVKLDERRISTLCGVTQSVIKYIIMFIMIVMILKSVFGIDIMTIVAVTGFGGLAIGFGAQNLVKDIITGFFILLENQYGVGELVTLNGNTGVIENIGLRVTEMVTPAGDTVIIPNSAINITVNHSRNHHNICIDIPVPHEEDVNKSIRSLSDICKEITSVDGLISPPVVLGVSALEASGVLIRLSAKSLPDKQFVVESELKKQLINKLKEKSLNTAYTKK